LDSSDSSPRIRADTQNEKSAPSPWYMRLYTYCKGKSREDEMREQQLAML
jgi:hypothetical protein